MEPNEINNFLEKYGLSTYQHRLLFRISMFSYKIFCSDAAPIILINKLKNNHTRNLKYTLRNSNNFIIKKSLSKFGDLTFDYFKTTEIFKSSLKLNDYKLFINNNIHVIFNKFSTSFNNLNLYTQNFDFFLKFNYFLILYGIIEFIN